MAEYVGVVLGHVGLKGL